jgi:hypothetical protein
MYNQLHVSSYLSFVKGIFNWTVNVASKKGEFDKDGMHTKWLWRSVVLSDAGTVDLR